MRAPLLFCALLSVGCDAFQRELPELFVTAPQSVSAATPKANQGVNPLVATARQLEHRLRPPSMPVLGPGNACPSAVNSEAVAGQPVELVLANVDVRTHTKNLIPRRVSERLESGESALLASALDHQLAEQAHGLRQDAPTSAATLTLEDLQRIQKQRYLGVFYLTDYQGPALILRVGKIRREWYPGSLSAKFFLYDTENQRTICSADLRVTNDVKSAPIRKRLQAETRGRLERELGDALRVEAERAASRFAALLIWPDSGGVKAQL